MVMPARLMFDRDAKVSHNLGFERFAVPELETRPASYVTIKKVKIVTYGRDQIAMTNLFDEFLCCASVFCLQNGIFGCYFKIMA